MIPKYGAVRVAIFVGALGLFVASPAVQAQTQKIRISLSSRSNTNTSYYVAQARGIFKDEGLEVEFFFQRVDGLGIAIRVADLDQAHALAGELRGGASRNCAGFTQCFLMKVANPRFRMSRNHPSSFPASEGSGGASGTGKCISR